MDDADAPWANATRESDAAEGPSSAQGLLDALGVAAMMLAADGRIVLWGPQAEQLLGYTAQEALGRFAARLLVAEEHFDEVLRLFSEVMTSGEAWTGVFPVRHKDGATRLLEFNNMRLQDERGDFYALALTADQAALHQVERDLALSVRLVNQAPIGLVVVGADLRCLAANAALRRMDGVSPGPHTGRRAVEVLPFVDAHPVEAQMRQVLRTGEPLLDRQVTGRVESDPGTDRAWSVSLYRIDGSGGRVVGLAVSVIDVSDRYRAAAEAEQARHRLALLADASVRIGTTLDLKQTAQELADVAVPELADIASVDILDSVLRVLPSATGGPAVIRALAVAAAYRTTATDAADPPGEAAHYGPDRLVTRCVRTGRPVSEPRLDERALSLVARDSRAAELLKQAGVHSYLAVPLIARGEVLGVLDLKRARNPLPFNDDDTLLAGELAGRAASSIDNALLFRRQRETALTLQRSMLPKVPDNLAGLEVASRYQPAGSSDEVGGDWFDTIPLREGRTALVVGDVMGSGINAATAMGRLRTATQTLSRLALEPAEVLRHLDEITLGMEPWFATCVYAVYDPHSNRCRLAMAGHLPPVLIRDGRPPKLVDLPTGAPLGIGGVPFSDVSVALSLGDRLVLYTDGLVETRHDDIDSRLDFLLGLLDGQGGRTLEDVCDRLLRELRQPDGHDDVALLIAQARR